MPKPASYTAPDRHTYEKTWREAAVACGMSIRTVQDWVDQRTYEPTKSGKWSTARLCKVAEQRREAMEEAALGGDDGSNSPALERYRAARAEKARLEVEEYKGQLRRRAVVEERETRVATVFRQAVWALPRRMAAELEGLTAADVEARLRAAVEEILDDLAGGRN